MSCNSSSHSLTLIRSIDHLSGSHGSILRTFAARHRERDPPHQDQVPGPGHHRPEEEQVVHEEGRKGTRRTQNNSAGNFEAAWFSQKFK